jgi:hypothetical protein
MYALRLYLLDHSIEYLNIPVICIEWSNLHQIDAATLTEVFTCFFLSCKANARVLLAKKGHGPHCSKIVVLFYVLFVLYRSVCKSVVYYCHRVTTQLQLTNISNIKNIKQPPTVKFTVLCHLPELIILLFYDAIFHLRLCYQLWRMWSTLFSYVTWPLNWPAGCIFNLCISSSVALRVE